MKMSKRLTVCIDYERAVKANFGLPMQDNQQLPKAQKPTKTWECKKCGCKERYAKNGECRDCARIRSFNNYKQKIPRGMIK